MNYVPLKPLFAVSPPDDPNVITKIIKRDDRWAIKTRGNGWHVVGVTASTPLERHVDEADSPCDNDANGSR